MKIGPLDIQPGRKLFLISGPCVIESREQVFRIAGEVLAQLEGLEVDYIYKVSYDKANRSAGTSYRGPGLEKGLEILAALREEFDIPVLTDVHTPREAEQAAAVVDIIQVPAFLCRQTDLLHAAAETGKPVNIKKGQFLAPWDITNAVAKVTEKGNSNIILTERGASFGYNTLVSDMRSIPIMQQTGYPVVFDATHSVQQPGGLGTASGGQREYVPHLARAAVAAGADGLFIETHYQPEEALSDGPNMICTGELRGLLRQCIEIFKIIRK
ncbi:3-deoxy-8-phosphooctulonate synthase [Planctomycetota bacterium]